jgi:hypothetical protein
MGRTAPLKKELLQWVSRRAEGKATGKAMRKLFK